MNPKEDFHLVQLLKSCAKQKDLIKGARLHGDILRKGLLSKCPHLASTLISMYAKCGVISRSQEVFDEIPVRTVVSWNSLISGYAQMGRSQEALNCFECMQSEGLPPDATTFSCILKACGNIRDVEKGKRIHDEIIARGLLCNNVVLGTALVDMYAKCGKLGKAREVHDNLPDRNVISWSTLISAYAQHGWGEEALKCFDQMQDENICPNKVTFTCILKACSSTGDIARGERIHDEVVGRDLLSNDIVLGTALVDMYAKCGALKKAQEVHDRLHVRSEASWNALISGYVMQGRSHGALDCLERMQGEGFFPDAVTFICALKACGTVGAISRGKRIHDEIARRGLLGKSAVLGNTLVDMYAKCGELAEAKQALEELHVRDVVSWNALMAGYIQHGQAHEALGCFEQMQAEGLRPDAVTFLCASKACSSTRDFVRGREIHDKLVGRGLLEGNAALGAALVDMCAKCGELEKARGVLGALSARNGFAWCALIAGYVRQGQGHRALECFEEMKEEGFPPDGATFACVLKACGSTASIGRGVQIHDAIAGGGLLAKDAALGNALVDMYAKCGELARAQKALEELPLRNEVAWSALIAGYVQQGRGHEALSCFERMKHEGFPPDEVAFTCILQACGRIGAVDKGARIHDEILSRRLLNKDCLIGTALVDMYAKCGLFAEARKALAALPRRNAVTWSALIAGYAQRGRAKHASECLERMQEEGFPPDAVTFLCVLNACSRSGLSDEAESHFRNMRSKHGIDPDLEHYTCMVGVFGYAGNFGKALSVIDGMPSSDFPSVWLALLGGCRKWGNVRLGRCAFHRAIELDKSCVPAYALMANIYAAAGMREDAQTIKTMRLRNVGLQSVPQDRKTVVVVHASPSTLLHRRAWTCTKE